MDIEGFKQLCQQKGIDLGPEEAASIDDDALSVRDAARIWSFAQQGDAEWVKTFLQRRIQKKKVARTAPPLLEPKPPSFLRSGCRAPIWWLRDAATLTTRPATQHDIDSDGNGRGPREVVLTRQVPWLRCVDRLYELTADTTTQGTTATSRMPFLPLVAGSLITSADYQDLIALGDARGPDMGNLLYLFGGGGLLSRSLASMRTARHSKLADRTLVRQQKQETAKKVAKQLRDLVLAPAPEGDDAGNKSPIFVFVAVQRIVRTGVAAEEDLRGPDAEFVDVWGCVLHEHSGEGVSATCVLPRRYCGVEMHWTRFVDTVITGRVVVRGSESGGLGDEDVILSVTAQTQSFLSRAMSFRQQRMLRNLHVARIWFKDVLEYHVSVEGSAVAAHLTPAQLAVLLLPSSDSIAALNGVSLNALDERDAFWGFTAHHFIAFAFGIDTGSTLRDGSFLGTPRDYLVALGTQQLPADRVPELRYWAPESNAIRPISPCDYHTLCEGTSTYTPWYRIGHDFLIDVVLQRVMKNDDSRKYSMLGEASRAPSRGDAELVLARIDNVVGFGVFASRAFRAGEYLTTYYGDVVSDVIIRESDDKDVGYYSMTMPADIDYRIDGRTYRNLAGMINHSRHANAHADAFLDEGVMKVVIVATRDILCGEQVCINYGWGGVNQKNGNDAVAGDEEAAAVGYDTTQFSEMLLATGAPKSTAEAVFPRVLPLLWKRNNSLKT